MFSMTRNCCWKRQYFFMAKITMDGPNNDDDEILLEPINQGGRGRWYGTT
jgi:hypothetical protein